MKFKQRNMKNILSRHKIIKLLKTSEKERLFKVVREKSYEQRNTGKDESRILVRNKASCQKKKGTITFRGLKEKIVILEFYTQPNSLIRNECKRKTF